jgi:hypothetical protein
MVMALGGQNLYADAELDRLVKSESTGPLGCLALASALVQIHSPAAQTVAMRGMTRLTRADFRADCPLRARPNDAPAAALTTR